MRKSVLRAASLLVALLVSVTACGGGSVQSSKLASDQTLKFPIFDELHTLDPGRIDAETDAEIAQNFFNGLVGRDNQGVLKPDIATSIPQPSADGLTYTFHLRSDVRFWNGDQVTAKDVLYSWNRAANLQGSYAPTFSPIEGYDQVTRNGSISQAQLQQLLVKGDPSVSMKGLTAPDGPLGHTVQVKLSHPAGWFLSAISLPYSVGVILDSTAINSDPLNWWQNPQNLVGTGAYRITQHTPKQSYDFQAVPNWWGSPRPTVQRVHIDILADLHTGIAAYEQGRYDLVGYGGYENFPIGEVLRIKNGSGQETKELALVPKGRSYWVSFNVKADGARQAKGPFTDDQPHALELRRAFALAVDKQKLARTVCADLVCTAATGGVIPRGLYGYLGDNTDPLGKFDPDQAKRLFREADPDGSRTRNLTYSFEPENELNKTTAQFLQDQWQRNLGVHVNIQPVNHSQFIPNRRAGQYVLSRDGWQADYNHPQNWFDGNWGSKLGCPDSNCTSGYASPAYDSLLAKANTEQLAKAIPDYQKLGRLLSQDAVYIPLYYSDGNFLFKSYLEGAGANNLVDYYWNTLKIHQH